MRGVAERKVALATSDITEMVYCVASDTRLIQFKLFELDRPFRMLYSRHELVNIKNLVSRWLISNIQS